MYAYIVYTSAYAYNVCALCCASSSISYNVAKHKNRVNHIILELRQVLPQIISSKFIFKSKLRFFCSPLNFFFLLYIQYKRKSSLAQDI